MPKTSIPTGRLFRALKAFRRNRKGELCHLFHARNRTRVVPLGEWLRADEKMVSDGSGKNKYRSGFNFFSDRHGLRLWKESLTHPVEVLDVVVATTRAKPTNSNVGLARWLYVPAA